MQLALAHAVVACQNDDPRRELDVQALVVAVIPQFDPRELHQRIIYGIAIPRERWLLAGTFPPRSAGY